LFCIRGPGPLGTGVAKLSLDLGNGSFDPIPLHFETHERHFEDAGVNRRVFHFILSGIVLRLVWISCGGLG
jgi:hypothetical protein